MRSRPSRRVDRIVATVTACMLCTVLPGAGAEEPGDGKIVPESLRPANEIVTWRVEFDNDIVFDSDNQFTSGWSLQKFGPPKDCWPAVGGTPAFGKGLAKWFLPHRRTDLFFREGWIIGQNLQTPDDLTQTDPIEDDYPYAASLAVQNTWIAWDDRQFHGFGWLLGVVGPPALGEETQTFFHELVGAIEPMGWDHQLRTEPLLNLYYQRKLKLFQSSSFDIAGGVGGQAGNWITGADVSVETRFGWHLPRGFLYIPDPIGRSLSYDSHLAPRKPVRWTLYGSLVVRASAIVYSLFLDGNTFGSNAGIDRNPVSGDAIVGLHYQRWRWGIHLHLWFATDTLDSSGLLSKSDTASDFGSLMFELRF